MDSGGMEGANVFRSKKKKVSKNKERQDSSKECVCSCYRRWLLLQAYALMLILPCTDAVREPHLAAAVMWPELVIQRVYNSQIHYQSKVWTNTLFFFHFYEYLHYMLSFKASKLMGTCGTEK